MMDPPAPWSETRRHRFAEALTILHLREELPAWLLVAVVCAADSGPHPSYRYPVVPAVQSDCVREARIAYDSRKVTVDRRLLLERHDRRDLVDAEHAYVRKISP